MVSIQYETNEIPDVSPEFLSLWLKDVCQLEGSILGDVSVVFCSDDYLLRINQEYLKHDYYTDIITFDYSEGNKVSGDLLISLDRVRENARTYGEVYEREMYRVIVHGVLHLIGYADKTEEESRNMREKEEEMLQRIVSRET